VSRGDTTDVGGIDAIVRGIDPLGGGLPETHGLERTLDEIGAAIVSDGAFGTRAAPRWRRWLAVPRRLAAVAAAVLAVGGVATAAVVFVNAHTGIYPTKPWEREAGGPGESLNLAGTNFRQVALTVASDIPFPPGYAAWRTWLITLAANSSSCPKGSPAGCKMLISTGALRGSFAQSAFCAWVYDWRQATQAGDAAAAQRAAQAIREAPLWKAVVTLDPHPHAAPPYTGRHGPMSDFGWLLPYRHAVLAHDVSAVDGMLAANYGLSGCASVRPPAASKSGTVVPSRSHGS